MNRTPSYHGAAGDPEQRSGSSEMETMSKPVDEKPNDGGENDWKD